MAAATAKEHVLVVWFWGDDKTEAEILVPFRSALPADWGYELVRGAFGRETGERISAGTLSFVLCL